jgi:hypothetical protein
MLKRRIMVKILFIHAVVLWLIVFIKLLGIPKQKLRSHAGGSSMEITVGEPELSLELTDTVSVRDNVTGMTAALQVWEKNLSITADGAAVKHILK